MIVPHACGNARAVLERRHSRTTADHRADLGERKAERRPERPAIETRRGHEELVLFPAPRGGGDADTLDRWQSVEMDLDLAPARRGDVPGVGDEPVRDVDARRRAAVGEPARFANPGDGVRKSAASDRTWASSRLPGRDRGARSTERSR